MPDTPGRQMVEALRRTLQARLEETHISWVLVTAHEAWKIKKPVHLPFLDARELATRHHLCEAEVRLNRRLAPGLYLGVVPLTGTPEAPALDGPGPVLDYAVHMRAFPPEALLHTALRAGRLQAPQLIQFAQDLARFHATARGTPPDPDYGSPACVARTVQDILDQLQPRIPAATLATLQAWHDAQVRILTPLWARRQTDGHLVEGHGDLHLGNALLHDGVVQAFDGIDFQPAFRWIDALQDAAFLVMDLMAHDREDLAMVTLNAYLDASGDHAGLPLLRHALVYRALVRALVARLRPQPAPEDPDYLGLALRLIGPGEARLLITHGVSGSGKSFVSGQLLAHAPALRLRSDVIRKQLWPANAPDLYSPAATAATYARLRELADLALQGGWRVIVDATCLERAQRERFRSLAAERQVPFTILHCEAPPAVLQARVAQRQAEGRDVSDADPAVLAAQLRQGATLEADEAAAVLAVTAPLDVAALAARWLQAR